MFFKGLLVPKAYSDWTGGNRGRELNLPLVESFSGVIVIILESDLQSVSLGGYRTCLEMGQAPLSGVPFPSSVDLPAPQKLLVRLLVSG